MAEVPPKAAGERRGRPAEQTAPGQSAPGAAGLPPVPVPPGPPSAAPRFDQPALAPALRPGGLHDLRRGPRPDALHYGPADLLVVSGLPGAGKSTLMARCAAHARLIDSQHVRESYQARLPESVPYRLFRPFVRLTHYWRLGAALRRGGPVVVHDCGTVPFVRGWLTRAAHRQGRAVHLLILDVDPATARAGQQARGRAVSAREFARHRAVAARALDGLSASDAPPAGWRSAVVIDRPAAGALREIRFTADG
ncbi:AAA family ATPase [Uniformispora flossi]|uniref:AAA family ATPase n=1 Tax=Uniformispora flossi TaxID=3390723 RepID=UPI003C2CDF52